MRLKEHIYIWLLRKRRPWYIKLKKLQGRAVSRDGAFLDLHAEILLEGRCLQTMAERYNLYAIAKATSRLPGALAEVGVYRGGSAKILCVVKGDSPFYLFDTFEGMPETDPATDGNFTRGNFGDAGYEDVVTYLSAFSNLHFYRGFFPDSVIGKEPEQQRYRFVHLDLDIYESTYDALSFFYPRMVPGGAIISHDYSNLTAPGVKKAFDDFFKGRKELVVPLWDTQCVVVKM